MKDNRLGGIALILGAVSGMITMTLHPVAGAHPITPDQFEKLASGLVGTEIIRKMIAHAPGSEQWRTLMDYNYLINQAFAKIFVVASCSAVALWSFAIVKSRAFPIAIGIYGLLLGPVIVIAMISGGISLDVHGFGLITFSQAIWFIVAGVLLFRSKEIIATSDARSVL